MIINCHKINLSMQKDIFGFSKPPIRYFEMTLHVSIAFKVRNSYNFAMFAYIFIFTN